MISWKLKKLAIADLKEFDINPRQLSQEQASSLSQSLQKFGIIDKPIVNDDCTIIGGHQRVRLLHARGETHIQCWVPNRHLSEEEVRELNIRLNKNHGDFDYDILANQWDMSELCEWGFTLAELGISEDEVDDKEDKKKPSKVTLTFVEKETMMQALLEIEKIAEKFDCELQVKA